MFTDYYQVLEIPFGSTDEEIKKAYRAMSFKYHPDRNPNGDTTAIMQLINEAYSVLSDKNLREAYDFEYCRFYGINQKREEGPSHFAEPTGNNTFWDDDTETKRWSYDKEDSGGRGGCLSILAVLFGIIITHCGSKHKKQESYPWKNAALMKEIELASKNYPSIEMNSDTFEIIYDTVRPYFNDAEADSLTIDF
ncbi:MAG: DnaJ domain-containing protein [Muribaculaceae bacterium]|nr:DnaJ domain-containing protein [Muribaculaceae bacterium]